MEFTDIDERDSKLMPAMPAVVRGEGQGLYRIRFRDDGQIFTALAALAELRPEAVVMVTMEHGLEPAVVIGPAPLCGCRNEERKASFQIERLAHDDEIAQYQGLAGLEDSAFSQCLGLIAKHSLEMHLVRVERFFNGSKIIFFFTADNRVDFRELVKDLVQEYRTRVEMRQVGVRHETKMIGGIGTCGRELCCSSFIKKFDSVSIKMAKEQDLPLNPTKISGLCNRLLCCLTYEYETYRWHRRNMPKVGKKVKIGQETYRVKMQNPLQEMLIVQNAEGDDVVMRREEWQNYELIKVDKPQKKEKRSKEQTESDESNS